METQVTPSKIGLRYGFITAIVLIIYSLILQLTGQAGNQALGWISFLILAVMIYLAHNAFKSTGDGYMRYGQGVTIGFVISLVGGVISSIFSYIYIKFVDDSVIKMTIDKAYEDMEARGMSDEEIEQAMGFSKMFMNPTAFLIIGIITTIILGVIISLIVSAITKKENPQATV